MPHLVLLLLKINVILLLFSAIYYLVLRRLTFYTANRIFLVFGILFSSSYPFIDLTALLERSNIAPVMVPLINQNLAQLTENSVGLLFWAALTYTFYVGVLFMAARLVLQFLSLRKIHNSSRPGLFEKVRVRILNENVSPFTFWQTIYINPLLHPKEDLSNILAHERIHVKEWHTLDIILSELCMVVYWFNPGVWLMKKAVRENIEFITDSEILNKGIDKKAYQYSLLQVGTLQPSLSLVNNFNFSDLKKRIKMMNSERSKSVMLTRYLIALPILLVTLAFTVNKKAVKVKLVSLETVNVQFLPKQKKPVNTELIKSIKVKLSRKNKSGENALGGTKVMVFEKSNVPLDSIASNSEFKLIENIIPQNISGKVTALKIISADNISYDPELVKYILKDSTSQGNALSGNIMIYKKVKSTVTPSYRLNGKEISSEELKNLKTSRIESMVVNKENGTVEFKTKD